MSDDARDLAAAESGDHEAFGRLYDRHAPVVLSLCRRSCRGSITEAEDATQETFIRAHRLLSRLDDPAKLRPWLYSIASFVCSERRRAAQRRTHYEGRAMLNCALTRSPPPPAPDDVARAEAIERLTAALDQLDDRERLAVHLHFLEADPVRAAASALGLSRSGYYKLLAKARRRLACLMREVQPT